MNSLDLAPVICCHQHPAEWTAPRPRQQPCSDCTELAATIVGHLLRDFKPRHLVGAAR